VIVKRVIPVLVILLLAVGTTRGQYKVRDYSKLTPAQIDSVGKEHLQMISYEADRREQAVKQGLLTQALYFNANQANYDVRYYGIHLSLDFTTNSIRGYIDYRIRSTINGLNSIDLNLINQLIVDSVKVGTSSANYAHSVDILAIVLPTSYNQGAEFAMQVYYHGQPYYGWGYTNGGMGFDNKGGYPICFTSCEPYFSRNWWPCKDTPEDKADSLDMYIECPAAYDVASNGVLVSNTNIGGGRRLFHWKHMYPITTYLVALTCADFDVSTKTWNYGGYSMPVYGYSIPNDWELKIAFDTLTLPLLNIYSDAFGIYPFVTEKLANANAGTYGTMEHQTCSFHESFSFYDPVYIVIHENAHQWWGDMITCKTFHHIWLNEGMGTYTESIFYEKMQGTQAYFNHIYSQQYFGPGTIYVEDPEHEVIFDGNLSYHKGAWVMHMLRGVLGDSAFFKAMKDWGNSEFRYGSATTEDFINVLSRSVGSDMTWFVHQWIYGDGHPDYVNSWICEPDLQQGGYNLVYYLRQAQGGGTYFKMPVRHRFVTTGGNVDTVLWNEGSDVAYAIHFADSVTDVNVDPQRWILRTVTTVPFVMHVYPYPLPDAFKGQPYGQRLGAIGGVKPYYWTYWGGDLPYGLSFQGDTLGLISGVPEWPATFYFTIRLTDSKTPPDTLFADFAMTVKEYTPAYICGDANGDHAVNVSDAVSLIAYIFSGGAPPVPLAAGDPDCSVSVNISDAVYLISYIFSSGSGPCAACK
jgi:Peptidase family M1 domain/Peptidase M1 N-terminal domain